MSEMRRDPVSKQWVIIAAERGRRPLDFVPVIRESTPKFCPFCPGHEEKSPAPIRVLTASGQGALGAPWLVRVVPNKYPVLKVEGAIEAKGRGIYDRLNGIGAHEVIVETPQHSQSLDELDLDHLTLLLGVYRERVEDLLRDTRFRYVTVFKNYGAGAGASVAHPHSQVIATPVTPVTVSGALRATRDYFYQKERCLFCDLLAQETEDGSRLVVQNERYVAFCPYASRVPFEVHILPVAHQHDYSLSSPHDLRLLSATLREVLQRLRLALDDAPYNLALHTAPNVNAGKRRHGYWETLAADYHWHIAIVPRLTTTAGFEIASGFYINPTAPEDAAQVLRDVNLADLCTATGARRLT